MEDANTRGVDEESVFFVIVDYLIAFLEKDKVNADSLETERCKKAGWATANNDGFEGWCHRSLFLNKYVELVKKMAEWNFFYRIELGNGL